MDIKNKCYSTSTLNNLFFRIKCFFVMQDIREIIKNSESQDVLARKYDYDHALDVYQWLTLLYPQRDPSFDIACLGHDIERSIIFKSANPKFFDSHREFKQAHSRRSAEILTKIMKSHNLPINFIKKVRHLVLNHEFGCDIDSEIISNMDSLGNIIWADRVLNEYGFKNSKETLFRMLKKLNSKYKILVKNFPLKNKKLFDYFEIFNRLN
jgi:hypothetical protein